MSAKPKLLRILDAIAARLPAIDGTGDYQTTIGASVRRTRVQPSESHIPCCLVYLDARESDKRSASGKAIVTATVVVEGYVARTSADEEATAMDVLSDIQRAMEDDTDFSLGGLLAVSNGGLTWQRDEILYPDSGESVIGARVEYLIAHQRKPGDPETA